jgi:superfamily II DNA or RNA helicase
VLELRPYQQTAVDSTWTMFEEYRRLLGVAATGAGKTIMFSALAGRVCEEAGSTLILADQDELIEQAVDRVWDTIGIRAQVEKGPRRADKDAPVVVSTIQSMCRRLNRWDPDTFELVIADEADKSASDTWDRTLNHFDAHARVLGVTATPNRADRKNIMDYFEAKAFDIDLFDLIRQGYLAKITVQTVPLQIDIRSVGQKKGDYDAAQLALTLAPHFKEICRVIREYAANRRVLIFWPLIATSRAFCEVANKEWAATGLEARHIDGADPDRRRILDRYRAGDFNVLSNAQLIGRGVDLPMIDCVINCRCTRHPTTYRQLIGRGTRVYCPLGCSKTCEHEERKKDLLVLDFMWQFERYGVVRPGDLIAKSPAQAQALNEAIADLREPTDLELLDNEVAQNREANLKRELEANKHKRGRIFDALEWATQWAGKDGSIRDLLDYVAETARDLLPITPYQTARLEKAKFDIASVKGYGHAVKIIEMLDARRRRGLCTIAQANALAKFGHPDPMGETFLAAGPMLDRLFGELKRTGRWPRLSTFNPR